jgi:DNA polymerase III subunit gamma/tau
MVYPHTVGDLYHKYRPRKFSEIVGHKEAVRSIKQAVLSQEPSQAFLLTGSSGTGKTTTARIMSLTLNCSALKDGDPCLECSSCKAITNTRCTDIIEVNAADHRGIGDIRSLCQGMPYAPLTLKRKIFILDEAHQLTSDAQSSLLKELEEAPKHVFIILCSTHPKKILPTVRNRCQIFDFKSLPEKEIMHLLESVDAYETGGQTDVAFLRMITAAAEGSPRNALVKLQQVYQAKTKNKAELSRLLGGEDEEGSGIELALSLVRKQPWAKLSQTYKEVSSLGAPALGMITAGYFRNMLLRTQGANAQVVSNILELFLVPFDQGKLGENNIVQALFKANQIALKFNGRI